MLRSRKHRRILRKASGSTLLQKGTRSLRAEALEQRRLLATITGVSPLANSHDAPASTDITATFDEVINAGSVSPQTFAVHSPMRSGGTSVAASGMTVTADPSSDFFPNELVQVVATAGIQGTSPAVPTTWQFRVGTNAGSGEFVESGQSIGIAADNVSSQGVELGDLDGDGDLDAFVANAGVSNRVYLNNGGVFTDSGQELGNGASREVALGDLDGDGDLDAVVANDNGQGNILWQNNGAAVFTQAQSFGSGNSEGLQLGDLDRDGDLDVFVANMGQANRVWQNTGGSLIDSGQSIGNHASESVELGDLDGDGDLDAFEVNSQYQGNRIWLNDGNGAFASNGQSLAFHTSRSVDLGDLDGDGDLDAFVANRDQDNRVWVNDGSGIFTDTGQLLSRAGTGLGNRYTRTDWVELGDMDADGDLDAFTVNDNGGPNRIWVNDGAGEFVDSGQDLWLVPGGSFLNNTPSRSVALGDVDNDGDLDAFVANDSVAGGTTSVSRLWVNRNLTPSVTLGIDNPTVPEAGGTATITATLTATHTAAVTVDLSTSGTATEGDDYDISGSQVVIPVGATSGAVTITTVQDDVDEPDETVVVDIASVTNGQEAGNQQVTATILDDDEPVPMPDVTLSVDNLSVPEDGGIATFSVNLSTVTTVTVTVDLEVSGTAAAADYTISASQIVLAPGTTNGSITVTAVDDNDDEQDETVIVAITNVTGGTEVGDQQQTTTIVDDDEPIIPDVSLTVDNPQIAEGGGVATLTVSLSETTTAAVTIDLGITGTATESDYVASTTQLVIAPGALSGTATVTASQDDTNEPDETVIVDVTNVINGNELGEQQQTITIIDDDVPPSFAVTSMESHASGLHLAFSAELDPSEINLFDTQNAAMGPADVLVVGATTGPVTGSLVYGGPGDGSPGIEADLSSITFLASGGPLMPDTYTVTLRSAEDGFKDASGALLDGDGDGTGGDDYSAEFTIAPFPDGARVIQIPDFVRGPGQEVNLPADGTDGIPITISEGNNVRAVDLRISYDPSLLDITNATAPAGGTVVLNTQTPGLAILVYFNSAPLPDGESAFINLEASVPTDGASENYGRQQVLDVHEVIIGDGSDNEFPSVVDDALQLASFFADVSGNGRVNAADAAQVARFAALIDGGFIGSLISDPAIVGDISGNGRINAADASLVARFAALLPVDQIPPLPTGVLIAGLRPELVPPAVPTLSVTSRDPVVASAEVPGFLVVELVSSQVAGDLDGAHDRAIEAVLAEEMLSSSLEESIAAWFES